MVTSILDRPTRPVVAGGTGGARQTIVVGVGRSSRSAAAVALAVRTAAGSGSRIVVVSVDEGPRGWALWGLHANAAAAALLYEDCRLQASARLGRAVHDFRLELCDAVTVTGAGSVTGALVDAVRSYGATEVVLGPPSRSRSRAGWSRLTHRSSRVETLRVRCPGTAVTVASESTL